MKKVTTNNTQSSKRSIAREYAFKFLYKHLLNNFADEKSDILENAKSLDEALELFDHSYHEEDIEHPDNKADIQMKSFLRSLIIGALKDESKYSKMIEKYLTNNNIQKVDRMNLAVLLLGTYEITSTTDTSAGVFINEYINIAKKYCPNDSHGFINSVLDKISKENK